MSAGSPVPAEAQQALDQHKGSTNEHGKDLFVYSDYSRSKASKVNFSQWQKCE